MSAVYTSFLRAERRPRSGAGQELTGRCQSWTLGNDAPLYVNKVVATNEGGKHHSNWIWVSESSYVGPDGTWPCAERSFDQIVAALPEGRRQKAVRRCGGLD